MTKISAVYGKVLQFVNMSEIRDFGFFLFLFFKFDFDKGFSHDKEARISYIKAK